jgi:hypothetical protein
MTPTANSISKKFAAIKDGLTALVGKTCDKDVLSAFCNLLISTCTSKKLSVEQLAALERSTDHLLNKALTKDLIDANAHRVIANWQFIMEGMDIPVWTGGRTDAEVLFLGCEKQRVLEKNKVYLVCLIKLRTGLGAGIISRVRFTPRQISFFLSKHSGTKSYNCSAEEISGMKASLVLELNGDEINVVDWKCTQTQKVYNRQLAEARRDVRKCPTFRPCNTCPKTTRECNLAIWLPEESNG